VKNSILGQKIANISKTAQYRTKVRPTTKYGYKLVHSISIGDMFDDVWCSVTLIYAAPWKNTYLLAYLLTSHDL